MINCKDSLDRYKKVLSKLAGDIGEDIEVKAKIKRPRVALVLYRDKSCEVNRYILPFVHDTAKVKKFLDEKCV